MRHDTHAAIDRRFPGRGRRGVAARLCVAPAHHRPHRDRGLGVRHRSSSASEQWRGPAHPRRAGEVFVLSYTLVSAVLVFGWFRPRDLRHPRSHHHRRGHRRVQAHPDATIRVFAVLAIVAFLVQSEVGRGYLSSRCRWGSPAAPLAWVAQVARSPAGLGRVLASGDPHGRATEVVHVPSRSPVTARRAS